jgi:hypothetical protein
MAKRYCIRIVQIKDPKIPLAIQDWVPPAFLECMQNANLFTLHKDVEPTVQVDGAECERQTFDIEAPE